MIVTVKACRACSGRLDSILDLGDLLPSHFRLPSEPSPAPVPLNLCVCRACHLVQLSHSIEPEAMFRQYWYRSGINEVMRDELADVVRAALQMVGMPSPRDFVLDVGANDGTLLEQYRLQVASRNILRIAVEPADNLQQALSPHCDVRIHGFFPDCFEQAGFPGASMADGFSGRITILTSIACFYDLDDPLGFIRGVKRLLHKDGVWIVQFQDLAQMLAATAFDNICHEHLIYYSLGSVIRLLGGFGLQVVKAEQRAINGGSLRLYIRHERAWGVTDGSVDRLLAAEAWTEDWEALYQFAWRVGEVRNQLLAALAAVGVGGHVIDLYGASTKGNTLLQYCLLGPEFIRQAWERSPEKVGRLTATGIPIVSEETGRADPPDALVCGIWQFREAVIAREAAYLASGRPIIFPLPAVEIVGSGRQPAEEKA